MKKFWLVFMVFLYVTAGIFHFVHPSFYEGIMPPFLPYPGLLIVISGICEILFGLLLIPLHTRRLASVLIILLLIAVFPANVQMAFNYYHGHNHFLWIALLRLPLQFLLIRLAYVYVKRPALHRVVRI